MSVTLEPEITDYIAADRDGDADRFGQCFAEQAVVRDEGHIYNGRAEIRNWHIASKARYQHRLEPLATVEADGRTVVTMRVSGNFPGSPVDAGFAFRLAGAKIAELEIGL